MKLIPSPLCTFCGDHEETLEHLLVKCAYSKEFWSANTSWLNNHNIQVDNLDEITILFGCFDNIPDCILLNHINLLGKYTIYIQLFRETLSEKSAKLHKPILNGSMGRRIELLHVLNTNEI